MKTFLIKTLGCKVNTYESEFIRTLLLQNNFEEVFDNADICIVNSCTVTNTADNKSKQVINNIKKTNPNAIVVALGCFTQFRRNEITNLIDADIILGNKDKSKVKQLELFLDEDDVEDNSLFIIDKENRILIKV